jgi:hypothetical protein
MEESRNAYKILVGKPEGKRRLGRRRRRWEDNIKMDVKGINVIAWTGVKWIKMDAVAGSCEHGDEPSGSIKGREFLD